MWSLSPNPSVFQQPYIFHQLHPVPAGHPSRLVPNCTTSLPGISTKFSWIFFPASMVQPVTSSWEEYRLDMPFGTSYPLEVDPTHQLCGPQDDYPNARKKIPCDEHPMADVWSPGFFFPKKKRAKNSSFEMSYIPED